MEVILKKDINTALECFMLLSRISNGDTCSKSKETIINKYKLDGGETVEFLDKLCDLEKSIFETIQEDIEIVESLFKIKGQEELCIADLILNWDIYPNSNRCSEIFSKMKEYSRTDISVKFVRYIERMFEIDTNDIDFINCNDGDIIDILDKIQISNECKWLFTSTARNYKVYVNQIEELFIRVERVILSKLDNFKQYIDSFCSKYEKIIENEPEKYFYANAQIKLKSNQKITIIPGIVGFNSILYDKPLNEGANDQLLVGVLFDEMRLRMKSYMSDEKICKNLKVISDASKFEILKIISDTPAYGQELSDKLGLTTATISHHMKALIQSHFIKIQTDANKIYYLMDRENIEQFLDQLKESLLK
ncbi:MAG: transcriptional regulator, ArsR family [Clostridiales bacterium]|nr:transcriptional regulator, ArsR family [Clostridiales bacterium]